MTQKQRKDLVTTIIQGATRKALRGEKPFKPTTEQDPLVSEFQEDFRKLAPLVGVDFEAVAAPVIAEELHF